jgi:hypothetical protein
MDPDPGTPFNPDEDGPVPSWRVDRVGLALAVLTLAFVAGAAWLRLRPAPAPEPPTVGSPPPPLRLLNLESSEPLFLLGLKGKVVWVVFWSAGSESGKALLPRLEVAWTRLRTNRRFSLVAGAVDFDQPGRVREALGAARAGLPAYLVPPETRHRFGVGTADPPLHLLIDADGKVAALVRGAGADTVRRLANQVRGWLEDLDPLGPTRFAERASPGPAATPGAGVLSRAASRGATRLCFDVEPFSEMNFP